ncbi:NUDIX hydrolase [Evansella tamaricis]|uniref:NUDIX hydrolase n=1 Tax=Evansella tamaricis TaxID=2069301 RepID=A0ABS6JKN8_9BACI|nr:NUDIX hydrolase [Evansella tamaricis]MBU9714231.1 NUDIX hydrolase [Evansella tamaricis]
MGYVEDLRELVGQRPLLFVGAVTILVDEFGRLLIQERNYPKGKWGLPGGLMELGETTEEAARRELFEETGLTVNELSLINVYSGEENFVVAENGDEFYVVVIAYFADSFSGEMVVDLSESVRCEFLYPDELPENLVKSHRKAIDDFLANHYQYDKYSR